MRQISKSEQDLNNGNPGRKRKPRVCTAASIVGARHITQSPDSGLVGTCTGCDIYVKTRVLLYMYM